MNKNGQLVEKRKIELFRDEYLEYKSKTGMYFTIIKNLGQKQ